MKTYLIQRGEIENQDWKTGLDTIVKFDCMGASEYEFGALPDSLKRLRKSIDEYTYLDVPLHGKVITVFCNESQKSEVKTYLEEIAAGRMRTKLGSYFNNYIKPSKHELEWQAKHPLNINFWWDIENDLMFWPKNVEFETKFKPIIATKPV